MKRILLAALVLLASFLVPGRTLAVPTTVHAFDGTDGREPFAGLILGADGNFYGTTSRGGTGVTNPAGTVFKMTTAGDVTTLYTFDFQLTGDTPFAGVVADGDGKVYGTTRGTGAYLGNVFRVGGGFQDLHTFSGFFGGADGSHSEAGVVIGPDGKLYGTTSDGGLGSGTVFRVGTDGAGYTVLHSFTGLGGDKTDLTPRGGLANGGDGNLYGTTTGGIGTTHGSVFRITTAGVVTTIHRFDGTDGNSPTGTLFRASDGKLYGTTQTGGENNAGTIYRIATDGTFASLHSFDTAADEGSQPDGVIEASDGNFYGTTFSGGQNLLGTIFVLTPNGGFATIASFGIGTGAGWSPKGALAEGPDGSLYGATASGGGNTGPGCVGGCGTIYKVAQGVPTTTSTTTSSSTTSAIATTSTTATPLPTTSSTSTAPTPSTLAVTTSTAAQIPNPTTTTLPTTGCPSGATFASVRCRLEALRTAIAAESGLGSYQAKLGKNVDKALGKLGDAEGLCASNGKNDAKKAKSRLAQVKKTLTQYAHTLKGLPARKKLDAGVRTTFLADGEAIVPDVTALRAGLACPADAAP